MKYIFVVITELESLVFPLKSYNNFFKIES